MDKTLREYYSIRLKCMIDELTKMANVIEDAASEEPNDDKSNELMDINSCVESAIVNIDCTRQKLSPV